MREFLARRADQHGVHEERVIGPRADDADLQPMLRMPTCEGVDDIKTLAGVEVVDGAFAIELKAAFVHRHVDRPPPHVLLRVGVPDHALILRRAAGLCAGVSDQCAGVGDGRTGLVADGMLIEFGGREVAVDDFHRDAVRREIEWRRARGAHGLVSVFAGCLKPRHRPGVTPSACRCCCVSEPGAFSTHTLQCPGSSKIRLRIRPERLRISSDRVILQRTTFPL